MNLKILFLLGCLLTTFSSLAETSYVNQFKNNYFIDCSKEMSSGKDAFPLDLVMAICSCSANSIVKSFNKAQLKKFDMDIASNYHLVTPHVESCTSSEFGKYINNHPEFLEQYIKQYPEMHQ